MARTVHIRFEIKVPASTPADSPVYVTGSHPALRSWDARGLQARRIGESLYRAEADLPVEAAIEFKVTRGDWKTVEVFGNGAPRPNRRRLLRKTDTVKLTVAQWSDVVRRVRGPVGLNHEHLVPSQQLGGHRKVLVHLPPGYETEGRAYPLLLMHDGQNLFDDATSYSGVKWAVDEAVDRLVGERAIEPIVVAGVWNSPNRMREYHPERPLCHCYERFLAEELIPWLAERYRLLPERTGVAGSSMGGIVSLHLAERRRDLFTRTGVLSPSIFASGGVLSRLQHSPMPADGRRIWMDMGTLEGGAESQTGLQKLRDALHAAGWTDTLACVVVPGGRHHEFDWARRLPQVLGHLYPPPARI